MSGLVGSGDIDFNSNSLVYRAEDGITETGPITPVIECTATGDTTASKETGDVVDWGNFSAVVIADDTVDVEALVNTKGTTTITYPLGSNSTAKTKAGTATMISAVRASAQNTLNTYAVEFTWNSKPTVTVAT